MVVHACQHEDAVTTIAGAYAAQTLAVYIRLLCYVINCREVVAHWLTTPVGRDGLIPRHAPAWHATAVGCYYDVALSCHQGEIPAEGIELCEGTLRASLTI